jgi:hypothetical protein
MRRVVRRARLAQPRERVFAACVDLLRTADPSRGVVERRVEPDPPAVDAVVHTTVRDRRGERRLRAIVVELQPPSLVCTVTEGAPAVRTELRCEDDAAGGTLVILTSDAEGALSTFGRAGALLDSALFSGGQRRAARSTLRRLRELAARD